MKGLGAAPGNGHRTAAAVIDHQQGDKARSGGLPEITAQTGNIVGAGDADTADARNTGFVAG